MIYLVFGRRELGKTTLAYHMVRQTPQRIVVDTRGLIGHGARVRDQSELRPAADALYAREVDELVFTPGLDRQGDFDFVANIVEGWVSDDRRRPLGVMVDEAAFFQIDTPAFLWVMRCCRRDVVDVIMTAHRPKDIPVDVRSIADHWVVFSCRQEHDLAVIHERCGRDVRDAVSRLEGRDYVHWDDAKGVARIHRNAAAWHVPLSPEPVSAPRRGATLPQGDDLPPSRRLPLFPGA